MNELRNNETTSTAKVLDANMRDRELGLSDESLRRGESLRNESFGDDSVRDETLRNEIAGDENRRTITGSPVARTAPAAPGDPDRPEVQAVNRSAPSTQANGDRITAKENTTSGLLFPEDELHHFRARWDQVQASFVDEPRHAVEAADTLVSNVVKRIAEQFAEERTRLEGQWEQGNNVSTEELRQGFRRYRFLFDRLLTLQPDASDTAETSRPVMAGR